jgi:hypothetical protein
MEPRRSRERSIAVVVLAAAEALGLESARAWIGREVLCSRLHSANKNYSADECSSQHLRPLCWALQGPTKCGGASSSARGNAIVLRFRFPAIVAELQRSLGLLFDAK